MKKIISEILISAAIVIAVSFICAIVDIYRYDVIDYILTAFAIAGAVFASYDTIIKGNYGRSLIVFTSAFVAIALLSKLFVKLLGNFPS